MSSADRAGKPAPRAGGGGRDANPANRAGKPAPQADGGDRKASPAGLGGFSECTAGANWQSGLAYALTGQWLDVSVTEEPEIDRLLAELERFGWDRTRLAESARHTRMLPPGWARKLGAARFAAVLEDLGRRLAPPEAEARTAPRDRPLDTDEQRLLADRPPHWS